MRMSVLYDKIFPVRNRSGKTFVKICACIVIAALLLAFISSDLKLSITRMASCKYLPGKNNTITKTILYWTKMFEDETFYFGHGDVFEGCPVSNCLATNLRTLRRIEDFDAVLFHGIQVDASDLPASRSRKQKYIFVDVEAPSERKLNDNFLPDGFYNWTMTYRRESDIVRSYGTLVDKENENVVYPLWLSTQADSATYPAPENVYATKDYARIRGKRKLIAWFVSHCRTAGQRERYVDEIKKYADVDIYGKCGPLQCPRGEEECYAMLESRYYFYLSFENSLCQDYVTEKLYKVMAYDVVPIVYGGVNYTEFAPPGSFINVADFQSAKHLVDYLNFLKDNPSEYTKYFWWKTYLRVDIEPKYTLCKMCEMLHDEDTFDSQSVVHQLRDWWSKDVCLDPVQYLKRLTST